MMLRNSALAATFTVVPTLLESLGVVSNPRGIFQEFCRTKEVHRADYRGDHRAGSADVGIQEYLGWGFFDGNHRIIVMGDQNG